MNLFSDKSSVFITFHKVFITCRAAIHHVRRPLFFLFAAFILLIAFLFSVPTFVSTSLVTGQLESAFTRILQRPVTLERLQWSWLGGITLSGLEIAEDPNFSQTPLLSLGQLQLSYSPAELFSKKLVLRVELNGLSGQMITDQAGQNNIKTLLTAFAGPEKPDKKTIPPAERKPILLPLDVQAHILLDGISLQVIDQVQNRRVLLLDVSLRLDVPSLLKEPVKLQFDAPYLRFNEGEPVSIGLNVTAASLFQADHAYPALK